MWSRRWVICATIAAASIAACRAPRIEQADTLDDRVFVFLECIDCTNGERARVILMGDSAVPSLRLALLNGPDSLRVDALERALSGRTLAVASPDLVRRQAEVYRGSYRRRAAGALRDIGGLPAHRALCESKATRVSLGADSAYVDSAIVRAGARCR